MLKHFLQLIWQERYNFWQDCASSSVFITLFNFTSTHNLTIIWLLWCWILINIGSNFWQAELQDQSWEHWLNSSKSEQIITSKWLAFLGFNCAIWLAIWQFWLLVDYQMSFWLLIIILSTIAIVLGLAVFIASLSTRFCANSSLLALIVLPLIVPILIYGSGFFWHLTNHQDPSHIACGFAAAAIVIAITLPKLLRKTILLCISADS